MVNTTTTLEHEELNRRANEVFLLEDNEQVLSVHIVEGEVLVDMLSDETIFTYKPDMVGRPQALEYLLGRRNDFND